MPKHVTHTALAQANPVWVSTEVMGSENLSTMGPVPVYSCSESQELTLVVQPHRPTDPQAHRPTDPQAQALLRE